MYIRKEEQHIVLYAYSFLASQKCKEESFSKQIRLHDTYGQSLCHMRKSPMVDDFLLTLVQCFSFQSCDNAYSISSEEYKTIYVVNKRKFSF